MNILKIIKDNMVLTIGIVVPVLLMLVFFLTSEVHHPDHSKQADIKYDILMQETGVYQPGLSVYAKVFVENGSLFVQYTHTDQGNGGIPNLYLYEAVSKKLRHLDFSPPDLNDKDILGKKILVESTRNLKIDTATTSPDGFEFTHGNGGYNHGGIINELFIGSSDRYNFGASLKRNGIYYRLPSENGINNSSMLNLIGWVVNKQE